MESENKISAQQACRIIRELFAQKVVGVDADGTESGQELNHHFLTCLRVANPELPEQSQLRLWVTETRFLDKKNWEDRLKFAEILRALADGIMETQGEDSSEKF